MIYLYTVAENFIKYKVFHHHFCDDKQFYVLFIVKHHNEKDKHEDKHSYGVINNYIEPCEKFEHDDDLSKYNNYVEKDYNYTTDYYCDLYKEKLIYAKL